MIEDSKSKLGFTLIELLIVIVIIGLLAVIGVALLANAQARSRDAKRIADLKKLQSAVEYYFADNNSVYPLTTSSVNTTWAALATQLDPYVSVMPQDPKNSDSTNQVYTYGANNAGTEYFIGAKLEQVNNTALNSDDDIRYRNITAPWTNLDAVESDDSVNEVVTTFDCGAVALDATAGIYCLSE